MRFFSSPAVLLLFIVYSAVQVAAQTCNGHAELCARRYSNVTYVGAHNSYAVGTDNLAANQDQDVTQQLTDGIRLLQMQVHSKAGVIQLCHTSCTLYDGGSLATYLGKVKTWMDANPNEVVTLLIVNAEPFTLDAFDRVFKTVGLDTISFIPQSPTIALSEWPTLADMLNTNQRLVTFLDRGADFAVVPYIIDEFTNMWETAFNVIDPNFDCAVNRTRGNPPAQMYLINHFLNQIILGQPAPFPARANQTNSASGVGSLQAHVDTCIATNNFYPNFMLVDFYEFGGGSVFQIAANMNQVTYNPQRPIASPAITATGTGATSVPLSGASTLSPSLCRGYSIAALSMVASLVLFS